MNEENEEISLEFLRFIEKKWQNVWRERGIYEAEIDANKPKFFITVPYPYTSGPLHIGHGRTYVIGDIIARFYRLSGYNVLFPMAFHVTGMPILAISDRIRRGERKVLDQYRGYIKYYVADNNKVEEILRSFEDPINVARFFANNIQRDFESIGLGIDWRRKFHTAEPIYNKFVEWQFLKLRDKGLIVRGAHYVRYCLLHRQAVGEDDIADGDVNPVYIQEFVAIKFKFEDGYILASTLRPETLYGATNMWVNPDAVYVKVKVNGEIWYVSEEALVKLRHQYPYKFDVVDKIEGKSFVGKHVISPLGDKLIILPATFVDPDRATGFVYSEPADAPYDYVALMDLKRNPNILKEYGIDPKIVEEIEPRKIINVPEIKGIHTEHVLREYDVENQNDPQLTIITERVYKEQYYKGIMNENAGDLKGLPVKEAREVIKQRLIEGDNAIIFYETSRKAVCRGGGKIIVARIEDQWFIDYSKDWWKDKSKEWLREMLIVPEKYRKLFEDTIDWLALRPCARGRGLGTKLPFDKRWVIESLSDSTIYMAFYTVAHIIREKINDPEKLKPEVFDYVFLGIGSPQEISNMTGVPVAVLEEMRRSFEYWYPNDLRHTATPHITNHLTFFIMHHIAIFPQKYWPRGISLNDLVILEGKKMSKSKGNVIPLVDIAKKYSADLFRLYIAGGADLDGIVDWKEKEVENLKRSLINFVKLTLSISSMGDVKISAADMQVVDKWLLSRFYRRLAQGREKVRSFRIREYVVMMFYEMLNDISRYRKRVNEERLRILLRYILKDWVIALSPIIPHIAEEIWSRINIDAQKWSINLATWPEIKEDLIDERSELLEDVIDEIVALGRELLRILKIEAHEATIIISAKWKFDLLHDIKKMIEENKKYSEIIREIMRNEKYRRYGKIIVDIIKRALSGKVRIPSIPITQDEIYTHVKQSIDYIALELGLQKIQVVREEDAGNMKEKAMRSMPLKPIIIFR